MSENEPIASKSPLYSSLSCGLNYIRQPHWNHTTGAELLREPVTSLQTNDQSQDGSKFNRYIIVRPVLLANSATVDSNCNVHVYNLLFYCMRVLFTLLAYTPFHLVIFYYYRLIYILLESLIAVTFK